MPVTHNAANGPMDGVDGARLKQLREAAGWDAKVLAIRASLSKEQVEQIENGGHDLFYNVSIKRASARKLALTLGVDPHSVVTAAEPALPELQPIPAPLAAPTWHAQGHDALRPARWKGQVHPMWWGSGMALTVGLVLIALGRWGNGAPPPLSHWSAVWDGWQQNARGLLKTAAPAETQTPPVQALVPAPLDAVETPVASTSPEPRQQPIGIADVNAQARDSHAAVACPQANDDSPVVQPLKAFKAGQMVFVQAVGDAHLCLRDHSGQVWSVNFKAGQERSFQGAPPWTVQSSSLAQFNVFFQGWKLRLPTDTTQGVHIVELQR